MVGRDNLPRRGPDDPRVESPVVPRLHLHPAHRPPAGDLRRQSRVLRRREDRVVLPQLRADPDPAGGRQRERAGPCLRDRSVARGSGVRDLSRGHAHSRRPAASRPHRCCPAGNAVQRSDRSGGLDRDRRRAAGRLPLPEAVPARRRELRRADRSRALRRTRARPHGVAGAHRRGHVRGRSAVGLRVRRHVCDEAGRGSPHRHRARRRLTPTPAPRCPRPRSLARRAPVSRVSGGCFV